MKYKHKYYAVLIILISIIMQNAQVRTSNKKAVSNNIKNNTYYNQNPQSVQKLEDMPSFNKVTLINNSSYTLSCNNKYLLPNESYSFSIYSYKDNINILYTNKPDKVSIQRYIKHNTLYVIIG